MSLLRNEDTEEGEAALVVAAEFVLWGSMYFQAQMRRRGREE